jgi:PKD repeat protein
VVEGPLGDTGDGSDGSSTVTAAHTYTTVGAFTITLTVTDNEGATGTAAQSVIASTGNLPPSAHIDAGAPSDGPAPLTVQFSGHGHDETNGLEHRWDFGDASPVQAFSGMASDVDSTVTHAYAGPGAYTCTLTVTDSGGLTATHTVGVTVTGGVGGHSSGGGRCGLLGAEVVLILALLRLAQSRRLA